MSDRIYVSPQHAKAKLGWKFNHVKNGKLADVWVEGVWRRYGYVKPHGYYYELTPPGGQILSALRDGLVT